MFVNTCQIGTPDERKLVEKLAESGIYGELLVRACTSAQRGSSSRSVSENCDELRSQSCDYESLCNQATQLNWLKQSEAVNTTQSGCSSETLKMVMSVKEYKIYIYRFSPCLSEYDVNKAGAASLPQMKILNASKCAVDVMVHL